MKLFIIVGLFFMSLNASAAKQDILQCTLTTLDDSIAVSAKLSEVDAYMRVSEAKLDLTMSIEASCEKENCSFTITFDSGILEDEAGQSPEINFSKNGKSKLVYSDRVEDASRWEALFYFL